MVYPIISYLQYQEIAKKSKKSGGGKTTAAVERSSTARLQDRTLQEMTDDGKYVEEACNVIDHLAWDYFVAILSVKTQLLC